MQRTGRKGHAMFRMVVQDSRRTPLSGKVVAYLGSYDPHSKTLNLDKEKVGFYLSHGAQPSPRMVLILKREQIKLPEWVNDIQLKKREVKNPDKRRSTQPASAAIQAAVTEAPAETPKGSNAQSPEPANAPASAVEAETVTTDQP
jgi:small subunit ribosomal protein S16